MFKGLHAVLLATKPTATAIGRICRSAGTVGFWSAVKNTSNRSATRPNSSPFLQRDQPIC